MNYYAIQRMTLETILGCGFRERNVVLDSRSPFENGRRGCRGQLKKSLRCIFMLVHAGAEDDNYRDVSGITKSLKILKINIEKVYFCLR